MRSAARPPSVLALAAKPLLLALVVGALLAGMTGGLLRLGLVLPGLAGVDWVGRAALAHAALMMVGFLSSVIAIERAVAVKLRWAFAAPLASGGAAVSLLLGHAALAAGLSVAAALVFVGINIVVVARQRADHTLLLLISALALLVGSGLWAFDLGGVLVLPWWFAFLVLTIAAERLEMTRLMRRRPAAQRSLQGLLAALLAGAALSASAPAAGGVVFGAALIGLALWLMAYDIARRTLFARGLSRYMAICLLSGYVWLGLAGLAWAATALGAPWRDAALHGLGLGFIVSMVMGHAPVILPAVARVKLQFGRYFYLPLALLHLSLLLRLGGAAIDPQWRALGAGLNAASILLFAITVLFAAWRWRSHYGALGARESQA
nr:hypothetical protein [uncultured Roseateles sp.]